MCLSRRLPSGHRAIAALGFLPKTKSSHECIGIVARPTTWRQSFQIFNVSASQDYLTRFQRGHQTRYHVSDRLFPFLLSQAFASSRPNIVFKGTVAIREMAELHRFHDAIDDHGRT